MNKSDINCSADMFLYKAIIDLNSGKTHDIKRLIELCFENSIKLIDDIECLIEPNNYAVEGRYSIIHDDINDARQYIEVLEKLLGPVNG